MIVIRAALTHVAAVRPVSIPPTGSGIVDWQDYRSVGRGLRAAQRRTCSTMFADAVPADAVRFANVLASFGRRGHGPTVMWFSTSVTARADQAARSASWGAAQDRTVPVRITRLPTVVTVIFRA